MIFFNYEIKNTPLTDYRSNRTSYRTDRTEIDLGLISNRLGLFRSCFRRTVSSRLRPFRMLWDSFGRFRSICGSFSDRFEPFADRLAPFRIVFGQFWTVPDRFRTVSHHFRAVSDHFRTVLRRPSGCDDRAGKKITSQKLAGRRPAIFLRVRLRRPSTNKRTKRRTKTEKVR